MIRSLNGVLFVVLFAGCATSNYTPTVDYLIEPEISVARTETAAKQTLGVRKLDAARPTDRALMYTEDGYSLKPYGYANWAESPQEVVTAAIMDALAMTGRFDVADAANMRAPELILTGTLRKFHEDRAAGPAVAVCEVRLDLRSRLVTAEAEAVWSETLRAETPVTDASPVGLARAMSESVAAVAADAAEGIVAALD